MDLTAEEMLQETITSYNKQVNDISKFSLDKRELKMFTEMMDKYAAQKWNQACKLQIESCSEKVLDLLYTDGDAESWHEKVKETKVVEYDNEPEYN